MRQWEHGGIPCAPYLFLLPTPGSRPPAAGDICLSSPHEAGGGTNSVPEYARGDCPEKRFRYSAVAPDAVPLSGGGIGRR